MLKPIANGKLFLRDGFRGGASSTKNLPRRICDTGVPDMIVTRRLDETLRIGVAVSTFAICAPRPPMTARPAWPDNNS